MTAPTVLKWHGGKAYLARRIVSLMPLHKHYVEPYAGGLSVLLAKDPEGVSEVVNDLDSELTNFWQVLRSRNRFAEFVIRCQGTPFSEVEWNMAGEVLQTSMDSVSRAWAFFVRCRQSLAGRMDSFAPLSRTRTRRGMNEQASAWMTAVDGLPAVHQRLRRVVILASRPALDVIFSEDGPDTLFYLDPPYLPETRQSRDVYAHEMTREDHKAMLQAVRNCQGRVMLSGYRNDLYDVWLSGWTCHEFEVPNNAAGGKGKRRMVESLWCNF